MISFTEGGILLNRGKSIDFAVIAYDDIVFNIGAGTDAYVFPIFALGAMKAELCTESAMVSSFYLKLSAVVVEAVRVA